MSSFLAAETGTIKKKWKGRVPVALLYPNIYPIAASNLGYQLVYNILNQDDNIVCERFTYPYLDHSLRSHESNRPLTDFSLIMGSVSFEKDYPNLITMLMAGKIEPLAEQRNAVVSPGNPLVVLGGVAIFMNPEPLAPFADLMIVGEAEPILPSLITWISGLPLAGTKRQELLEEISSSLPGCYVPSSYTHVFDNQGRLEEIVPRPGAPKSVKKLVQPNMECAGHSRILSPAAELNMFMVELGRGCSQGCRFCCAGFIYRAPRLWHEEAIIRAIEQRPKNVKKIGLLGMEMVSEKALNNIMEHLRLHSCVLSFSSLRADRISLNLLNLLSKSKLQSAAIAPDGCSERLRLVINKGLKEQDLLQGGTNLIQAGINNLKLYIMVGLPTETYTDLDEFIDLVHRLKREITPSGKKRGRIATITLSVNSFVPKPWTPFQFTPFGGLSEDQADDCRNSSIAVLTLKKKIKYLRKGLAGEANIRINSDRPKTALQQAVLARGDRNLAPVLIDMAAKRLSFSQAMAKHGLSSWKYAIKPRKEKELFCWEILDHGISKDYLWQEYRKGLAARPTSPCDPLRCRRCGVCNENPSK